MHVWMAPTWKFQLSSISINSNVSSLQTQRRLSQSSSSLNQSLQRLSSGQRINRASDDAAGLAISDSLAADRRVLDQGVKNLNDGASLLSIGSGALAELTNIVTRVQELAEQAANGTLGYRQRQSLDKEAQQLSKEYSRIAQTAEFNGIKLFDGSTSSVKLQVGYGASGAIDASMGGTKGIGTFAAAVSFSSEAVASNAIALGDFNGDGNLDIVTAGQDIQGGATVRLGNGNGTFGSSTYYISSENSVSNAVTVGDLNSDGNLDFVTSGTNGANGVATIRFGNGNGTFAPGVSYLTEAGANGSNSVAVGDVNADGVLDLVTGGSNLRATVRLGTGGGSFGAATSYVTNDAIPSAISLADLNNDGNLDLVSAGSRGFGGLVSILLGTGSGTFGSAISYAADAVSTAGLAIGDLNGDGILDIATAGVGSGGTIGVSSVRLGLGDGNFGALATYSAEGTSSNGINLGDLNGDGILDMVTVGSSASGRATIRLGNGNGTFGAAVSYLSSTTNSFDVALGDLNGDGVLDIAAGGSGGGGKSSVFLGNTSSGVGALLPFSLQYRHSAVQAMADLDRTLERVSNHRGLLGAYESRTSSAISTTQITAENYRTAESQIRDSDVALETAELVRNKILQQAGAAVLAQANLEPQIALTLLQAGSNG